MNQAPFSHLIGFDDAPFSRGHRGDVLTVGAVYAGARLDGVLSTRVRRDGANATRRLAELVAGSRFHRQLHAVLLQGIALAGFNVVDVPRLADALALPVLVVARHEPDMAAVRRALMERVPGGARKWRLIERLGPMEPMAGLHVQRWGIDAPTAERLLRVSAINGKLPEPLRTAHLIAGGVGRGESRHRA
ncbi:DUF99 family protein [Ectothiorhodospiraceae bacterium WFHF3C12]|nr:DUF99 family protein [Ectothiorhodospiraceae bacterium WFHF3C12]